jgi:hypothetical protein
VTEAWVARIGPDPFQARVFYLRAVEFAAGGGHPDLAAAPRQVLLHNAVIAACDAILAVSGRQIEGSDGGHRLRLQETERLLGSGLDDLFERLDDVRATRAEASYRGALVPDAEPAAAEQAVLEFLEHARAHIAPHLPEHYSLGE